MGPEAYGQRRVDKVIISGSGCLRKSEKLTHDGSTCFAYKCRAAASGVVNVPRDPTLPLPNTFLLSSNMPPRGSNERLDFTPILTHYLFLFTSVFAVVSLLPWHPLDHVSFLLMLKILACMVHRFYSSDCRHSRL